MYLKNQKFFILGISKSGYFATEYILSRGGKCIIYDESDNERTINAIKELVGLGALQSNKERCEGDVNSCDVFVISPGVPINHPLAVLAKTSGKRIVGELELGFECFTPPIIAVTGTNGKTTTVSLIKAVLDKAEIKSTLCGNVGVPVCSVLDRTDKDTVCVTEVSSFQSEGLSDFKPHIACVLNLSSDHLERHFTMENYAYLKKRILKNQKESEYAVLNFDDVAVKNFKEGIKSETVWVSTKEEVDGAYYMHGKLYYKGEFIIDEKDLKLSGLHNVYNTLFTIATCRLLGVDCEVIASALKEFKGVSHRIELVGEIDGVKYYDDSKATNTSSALTAIRSMKEPTVLILGGSEKGEEYDEMFVEIKNSFVKHVVITGASRFNMIKSATKIGLNDFTVAPTFEYAVKIAKMFADGGDAVLLSPACASFDEFKNYEERGDKFKSLVGVTVDEINR